MAKPTPDQRLRRSENTVQLKDVDELLKRPEYRSMSKFKLDRGQLPSPEIRTPKARRAQDAQPFSPKN